MITTYYDSINRVLIQSPGNQTLAVFNPFVYGDNFDLQIYLVQNGSIQKTINVSDTITILLFQKTALPPYTNLCIPGTATLGTDSSGNNYFLINLNLATEGLAALVQATGQAATCALHIIYNPVDGERISDGEDIAFIVNVDPTQGSTGGTPAPAGYPSNPSVFQLVSGKDAASGYVGLNSSTLMNPNEIPLGAGLSVVGGQLTASGGGGGSGPDLTTFATFTIPAKSAMVAVTVAANTDLVNGMLCTLTDGTNFMLGKITNIASLVITFKNLGVGGATSGTMGAGVLFIGGVPDIASPTLDGLLPQLTNTTLKWLRDDGSYQLLPAAAASIAGTITGPASPIGNYLSDSLIFSKVPPILTTFSSFTIPASGSTVVVAVATIPDFITNEVHVLTDGTNFMVGTVTSISGLNITYTNVGTGAVSGTMGAGRIYMGTPSASGSSGIGQHGARRYNSTTITYSTAGTTQALTFDTSIFDTDTYYSGGKFTVPTGQAGYYSIGACVNFAYVASQTFVFLAARLNGTTNNNIAAAQTSPTLNGSQSTTLNISTIYHLSVGDYIEIVVEEGAVASNLTAAYFGGTPSAWLLRTS